METNAEETWKKIETSRLALGEYLKNIDPSDWEKQSWCEAWTVKDAAAHLLVIPTIAKGKVFFQFLKSGFKLDKMNDVFVKQISTTLSTDEIAAKTIDFASSQTLPPGLKLNGAFGETVVHSIDVSEGVSKALDLPTNIYVDCLEYYKDLKSVFEVPQRIAGLQLKATDAQWQYGDGQLVEGPAKYLLSAITGRKQAIDKLTGAGVEILKSRI